MLLGPAATPSPVLLLTLMPVTWTLVSSTASMPSPAQPRTVPFLMETLERVAPTRIPSPEEAAPTTPKPLRSRETLLALMTTPLKPAAPTTLAER